MVEKGVKELFPCLSGVGGRCEKMWHESLLTFLLFFEEYSVLLYLNIKDVYWEKQGEDNAFLDRFLL